MVTAALRRDRRREPAWFPDWSGQACAIIASGPSAKKANIAALRGKLRVIAIKECAVDLCPWADVAYGCDAAWWRHRRGLPDFKGFKISHARELTSSFPDIRMIDIKPHRPSVPGEEWVDRILIDEPGIIGAGRNSAFQALNIAVQFGSRRAMFIGLDLHGEHYYGRNNWFKAGNPDEYQFDRCIRVFNANAQVLKSMGVDVVNASPTTRLQCFRRSTIEHALTDWHL